MVLSRGIIYYAKLSSFDLGSRVCVRNVHVIVEIEADELKFSLALFISISFR